MKKSLSLLLLLALEPSMAIAQSPAPPAPEAAPANKPTKLELPPNATRDEVKAILRKQGLSDNDKQVDGIMAKLEEAKSKSNGLHGFVQSGLPGMDLEYIPMSNQYHAKGLLNGQPASFIIDSGAHASVLSTATCERLGMKTERIGTGTGIGGEEALYSTEIESLALGPHLKFPAQTMRASGMNQTKEEGNEADGLIGADILTQIGGIIDYRTHRLAYPDPKKKQDLSEHARASGFQEIALKKCGVYSMIEANIKGQPARFIIDTGAQQSVLDTAFAKHLGLPLIATDFLIQGIGEERKTAELTSMDDMTMGAHVKLHRMPMLVMPLDHVQMGDKEDRYDGILGAEFLYATGAVFDTGNQKLYIEPGLIDVRDHIKTGPEMFGSDQELKQSFAATPRVLAGKITAINLLDRSTTDAAGKIWKLVQLKAVIGETLKGEAVPAGTQEDIHVLVKDEPNLAQSLSGSLGRNPSKIFFLDEKSDKSATAREVHGVVWTDGELPRAQLKRVGKGQ